MRKQIREEDKLKALNQVSTTAIIRDVVVLILEDVGEEHAGDRAIEVYCSRIIERLKKKYQTHIKGQEIGSKQRDLLELIDSIKTGKEPEFINQVMKQIDK